MTRGLLNLEYNDKSRFLFYKASELIGDHLEDLGLQEAPTPRDLKKLWRSFTSGDSFAPVELVMTMKSKGKKLRRY